MLSVGSTFSGIGGFDLGFERAGLRTVWFCEQDAYCRRVLARHWPGVPCHSDVRTLVADSDSGGWTQQEQGCPSDQNGHPDAGVHSEHVGAGADVSVPVPSVDVLCGGFPCQDLSVAGRGAGIDGARSGLWAEYARLIGELRPRYVVVENVAALLARGMGRVLGDLAALGYDAEWDCLPASAFGAPHRRDRVWLVAYPGSEQHQGASDAQRRASSSRLLEDVADSNGVGWVGGPGDLGSGGRGEPSDGGWWAVEPDVGRVAYGVPARVDRLRSLGNSLVPQIAEWIGRRIIEWERANVRAAA